MFSTAAEALSAGRGLSPLSFSHQCGHVAAALTSAGAWRIAAAPFLAFHVSGGTTEVLSLVDDHLTLLGGTLDLHAGQVVDRTGVALGLPFPAGPHLEELAVRGTARALLPVAMADGGLYCHLSGAETQVQRWIVQGTMPKENIAREVYDLLARTVSRMVTAASQQTGIHQVLIAGGVASSRLFRELVTQRTAKRQPDLRVHFGRPEYSGDNAVGVALIGARKWREQQTLKEIEYGNVEIVVILLLEKKPLKYVLYVIIHKVILRLRKRIINLILFLHVYLYITY